ncbi:hypothetical protein E4U30_006851 [Claviceps sp. LM220 group G6]|nr:hypothetical protein E4U30_006851 [Claviceps sp. LM220 group G6]
MFNDQQKLVTFERSKYPAVPTDLKYATEGIVTNAEGRSQRSPAVHSPLERFSTDTTGNTENPTIEAQALPNRDSNRAYLRERRKKPKIVDSEKSLKHRQEEALTRPVEFLIKELEHITNL